MVGEEVCSDSGGSVLDIEILRANAFNNLLASERIIWRFILRVAVCMGMLGVTEEIISTRKIDTRHWMGK